MDLARIRFEEEWSVICWLALVRFRIALDQDDSDDSDDSGGEENGVEMNDACPAKEVIEASQANETNESIESNDATEVFGANGDSINFLAEDFVEFELLQYHHVPSGHPLIYPFPPLPFSQLIAPRYFSIEVDLDYPRHYLPVEEDSSDECHVGNYSSDPSDEDSDDPEDNIWHL